MQGRPCYVSGEKSVVNKIIVFFKKIIIRGHLLEMVVKTLSSHFTNILNSFQRFLQKK